MEELGLTRVPYYSELSVFNRDDVQNDAVCLVLSVMLYWHSLEKCQRFNARNHVHLLARNLRRTPECVKECLDYLTSLKILDKKEETITTESDNPDKKTKLNEFYTLNFHVLHELLKEHNLNIPVKILRLASDDYFDIYSYLSPKRMPLVQGLVGMVKGGIYDEAALKKLKLSRNVIQDAWTVTFSPDYSVAIWYGYDNLTKKTYNTTNHAWAERTKIQKEIVNNVMEKNSRFERPSGIVASKVVVGSNPPMLPNRTTPSSKNVIKKLHIPFDYTREHYNYYTLSLSEELPF